jgi:hypothetical protein
MAETLAQSANRRYWEAFLDRLDESGDAPRRPGQSQMRKNHLYFPTGMAKCQLVTVIRSGKEGRVWAELLLDGPDAVTLYDAFYRARGALEAEIGDSLEFRPRAGTGFKIMHRPLRTNPERESDWTNQHRWLEDRLRQMERVFVPRLRSLRG